MRAGFFQPALFAVFALIAGNGFCADDAVPSRDKFEHADYIVFAEVERIEAPPEVVIVKTLESFKRPPGAAAPARARVFLGQPDALAQPGTGARWVLFLRPQAGAAAGDGLVALLGSTVWLLVVANDNPARDWKLWLLSAISFVVLWRTKFHLLRLLGGGAVLGALGWV